MDLDSPSFFENNVAYFLNRPLKQFGADQVSEKFDWMYTRITNDEIIQLAKPLHNAAMRELKKVNTGTW